MEWIPRQKTFERVLPFVDKNIVKVITGIRRCGKSVMMELIQKELLVRNVPEASNSAISPLIYRLQIYAVSWK